MKIGIDARWYHSGPVSGKNCIRGLINAIKKTCFKVSANSFVLISEIHIADFKNIISPRKYILFYNLLLLPFILQKHKIDWVVCQNFGPWLIKSRNNKVCLIVHDIIFESNPEYFNMLQNMYFRSIKRSCKKADLIIAVSNYTKGQLVKYNYANEKKIKVVYNGFTSSRFQQSTKQNINLPTKYILYVGRIDVRKNLVNLIESFLEIKDSVDEDLVIVGSMEKNYRKMFPQKYFQEKRIHFLGYIKSNQMYYIYQKASLFIYIPFVEGFGLPIVEAMNFGLPCIVSNVASLPEVGGDAVIYVNPTDFLEISRSIKNILSSKKLRITLSDKGKRRAKIFTWEYSLSSILNFIRIYSTP